MSKTKKQVREAFRNAVFERDKHVCRICGRPGEEGKPLDAHHITDRNIMPNGGYVKENGISLCWFHHDLAELWHRTLGVAHAKDMKPEDLYKLIGSSYEQAIEASSKEKKSRGYDRTLHKL